ncbi:MAG: hypothetical protein RSG86_05610, partial [Oscillospiraceae bacterium]
MDIKIVPFEKPKGALLIKQELHHSIEVRINQAFFSYFNGILPEILGIAVPVGGALSGRDVPCRQQITHGDED